MVVQAARPSSASATDRERIGRIAGGAQRPSKLPARTWPMRSFSVARSSAVVSSPREGRAAAPALLLHNSNNNLLVLCFLLHASRRGRSVRIDRSIQERPEPTRIVAWVLLSYEALIRTGRGRVCR